MEEDFSRQMGNSGNFVRLQVRVQTKALKTLFLQSKTPVDPRARLDLSEIMRDLQKQEVIIVVPKHQRGLGVHSPFILIKKKT